MNEDKPITYDELEDEAIYDTTSPHDWVDLLEENSFVGENLATFILRTLKAEVENTRSKHCGCGKECNKETLEINGGVCPDCR